MKFEQSVAEQTQSPLKFGKPIFKACSYCNGVIRIVPLESGHALGGILWSDGYMQTPQLPEQPLLGKCPSCGEIVSLAELVDYPNPDNLEDPAAYDFGMLELDDYRELLNHLDEIDPSYHIYLRMTFWQVANHSRRTGGMLLPLTMDELDNLEALAPLLGDDESERLIKAEVLRQLGEFQRAKQVLSDPFQQRVQNVVVRLKRLVDEENPHLARIFSGEANPD